MAQAPSTGRRLFNIMANLRGNFGFNKTETPTTQAFGSPDILTGDARLKMINTAERTISARTHANTASSMMDAVTQSFGKVGKERLEYRKILQLMPDVAKAARLMVASILSPNDLARQNITVTFNRDDLGDDVKSNLQKAATEFFQKKLNLKKSLASWIYQFGYESGSAVFAIIPMTSFQKIHDNSFIGTEAFQKKVIAPLASETLFGFGDGTTLSLQNEEIALESLAADYTQHDPFFKDVSVPGQFVSTIVKSMIGTEALSLTDNPSVLQIKKEEKARRAKRNTGAISKRYKTPTAQTVVAISAEKEDTPTDNPLLVRLPPESVTVIHTPGDPTDHQGYLVLLDQSGNPITALMQETDQQNLQNPGSQSLINQSYNAYGFGAGNIGNHSRQEMTERLYSQVISEHLRKRLNKSGFDHTELGNTDAIFRCMFSRFMQQKQTRILFLPKELVTYMTFEMDEHGYGISRLEGVKFNIGMKMALQVSRTLATIKTAMDKRRIELKFTENMMEQPEAIIQSTIQQYVKKNSFSFTHDPNVIQNQITSKSISIQGVDVPGMEQFGITNEPDTRAAPFDDSGALEYQDKAIMNGLHVPAATMNSLNEDEYARSVVTTNLFFSMDVSIDQDVVIDTVSDLLRKYAAFSKEFNDLMSSHLSKKEGEAPGAKDGNDLTKAKTIEIASLISDMTIALPLPNVAPSKTQFESVESMTTSITALMQALLPDELAGGNQELVSTIALLRAKFTANNIAGYLSGSGMTGITIPNSDFAAELRELGNLSDALTNVAKMLADKAKLATPADGIEEVPPAGY